MFTEEIDGELAEARHAAEEGNHGKARVCARRAAGKAFLISKYSSGIPASTSAMEALRLISENTEFSDSVREAAVRLLWRASATDQSPAPGDPVGDAVIIVSKLLDQ